MSSALAIAAVSALIRHVIREALAADAVLGSLGTRFDVKSEQPETIRAGPDSADNFINVFFYQASPNIAWRNMDLPPQDLGRRITSPLLALDLHYLISAYGTTGTPNAEILLAHAMRVLHDRPVLKRRDIAPIFEAWQRSSEGIERSLARAGLEHQVEELTIAPQSINGEEMSRLWTALQASYRPSAGYQVSVVLIETPRVTRSPLPVLTLGGLDPEPAGATGREAAPAVRPSLAPAVPMLRSLDLNGQPAVRLGDTVLLGGDLLAGTERLARFVTPRLPGAIDLPLPDGGSPGTISIAIPAAPPALATRWIAGVYAVSVVVRWPGEASPRTTNTLPLAVAPEIAGAPLRAERDPSGQVTAIVGCNPPLLEGQIAALVVGDQLVTAEPPPAPGAGAPARTFDRLTFRLGAFQQGTYRMRLRIDGVESLVVDRTGPRPRFDPDQVLVVPP